MKRLIRAALLFGTMTFLVWGASRLGAAVDRYSQFDTPGMAGCLTAAKGK